MQYFSSIIVLLSLAVLLGVSAMMVSKKMIRGESARKLVHVGMGLICLTFPWLFTSVMPVFVLAGIAVISILILRMTKLRRTIGASLFSVNRLSVGELIFPLAVAWLFALSHRHESHSILFYTIPILLLTFADTVGALVGTKLGNRIYTTAAGKKSLEGSLAFFVAAFACTFIPLAIYTNYEPHHISCIALTIALLMTAVEGISGMGMDNILIPIGSYFLIDYYTEMSTQSLWIRVICMLSLLLLMLWTCKKHIMNGGAILTGAIFCFTAFMLGSWLCFCACMILFVRHMMTIHKIPEEQKHTLSIDTILAISAPALVWLTLSKQSLIEKNIGETFFILSLAITIALLHAGTEKFLSHGGSLSIRCILKSAVMSAVVGCLCYPLVSLTSFGYILISNTILSALSSVIFYQTRSSGIPTLNDWIILCIITAVSTAILFYSHGYYFTNI